jgi:peptidoglycan/LPS O-acetylase OafA/YrhL
METLKAPVGFVPLLGKDNNIGFLRFLFAFVVLLAHTSAGMLPNVLTDSGISVCGFFVLSGFLVTQSYWRTSSVKKYFIKRCKRILPAYYFVTLSCAFGLCLLSTLSFRDYFTSPVFFKYVAANLCFLSVFQHQLPGVFTGIGALNGGAVNGSVWTITIEVCFYLSVPILAFVLGRCKTKRAVNILLAVLYAAGLLFYFAVVEAAQATGLFMLNVIAVHPPWIISAFFVGIFFSINHEFVRKYLKFAVIPALAIMILFRYILKTPAFEYFLPIVLGIIIFFISFEMPFLRFLNGTTEGGAAHANDYSYGVYLFHFPVMHIYWYLGVYDTNPALALISVAAVVFSLSYISWHFLEKRFLGVR